MTDLFRFMVLRAPQPVDTSATIPLDGSSESSLIVGLKQAAQSSSPLAAMGAVAKTFIAQSQDFVRAIDSLNFGEKLAKVVDEFQNPAKSKSGSNSLTAIVHRLFPTLAKIVMDKRFLDDKRRIEDSLVALQIVPASSNQLAGLLVNLSRVINLLERAAIDDSTLKSPGVLFEAASRIVVLPPELFPLPSPVAAPAIASGGQIVSPPSERIAAMQDALVAINNMIAANAAPSGGDQQAAVAQRFNPRAVQPVETDSQVSSTTFQKGSAQPGAVMRSAAPRAASSTIQAAPLFSPQVQSVLMDLHLDLTKISLASASEQLNHAIYGLRPAPDPFHEVAVPPESADPPPPVLAIPPTSHGSVQPAGIADLLVVREHVLRYEPGEIAFVENVAAGETFSRQTVRKNTTENSTLTTTFSGSQTERDLQVADRFNLQAQAQTAVNDSSAPGSSTSDAYGPLVDSSASSGQSVPQAASFGQDVTSRAVTMLITSTQTQVLQQSTSEFDETVAHNFDNKAGSTVQIVVYQWLDKIVQAKVFSYGKRVLYDFVIPEPAVFLAFARSKWQPELAALQKPTLFALQPQDLSTNPKSSNYYQYWAAGYGASGIQPPPEPKITIVRAYGDKGSDPQSLDGTMLFTGITAKENVDIPPGYSAVTISVAVNFNGGPPNLWIGVVVGTNYFDFTQTSALSIENIPLNHSEVGQIPVSVLAWNGSFYIVNIEINCQPTAQNMAQWQARTHDTILQASRDRLAEYEDQLHSLTADLQVKFAGKSSDQKQVLIRAELEKGCVSILSNQHFDGLSAVEYSPSGGSGFPQSFLPNVEAVGRYIRFFEQAFEWDQMLYRYYPYFWGRKKYWNDRLQLDDQDAEFAAFLGAGAARVTVPVRSGYEAVVATFMTSGTIPSAADILSVTTGLYVPFFVETMGSEGGPDSAVPYGNPPLEWEVRVPTTLVKVRANNTLPRWKQSIDAQNRVTYVPVVPGDPVTP
jgi:hypothetical protein